MPKERPRIPIPSLLKASTFKMAILSHYMTLGGVITVWLRLRENGLTLKAVDKKIMSYNPDWKPGQALTLLRHPYNSKLYDLAEIVMHCHGVDKEQLPEEFGNVISGFLLHVYLRDRLRRIFNLKQTWKAQKPRWKYR